MDQAAISQLQLRAFREEQEDVSQPVDAFPKTPRKEKTVQTPFILSGALPVVQAKMVKRILKGQFIDMCELLKDNMEADRKRALRESKSGLESVFKSPTLREVPDLLSWLQCFSLLLGW